MSDLDSSPKNIREFLAKTIITYLKERDDELKEFKAEKQKCHNYSSPDHFVCTDQDLLH